MIKPIDRDLVIQAVTLSGSRYRSLGHDLIKIEYTTCDGTTVLITNSSMILIKDL